MISHEYKCIFIHIPKTAGMSVISFFYPGVRFHHTEPDYERLFGWCPKRKLHMQHATAKQLIETGLVTEKQWAEYYKFTFVRNPWDRAYSDYKWIQNFSGIKGSFKSYIKKEKAFYNILNDNSNHDYLGDHLLLQTDFFDFEGAFQPDFIGRFENFSKDIGNILHNLSIDTQFNVFENSSSRVKEYSWFYTNSNKRLIEKIFDKDIKMLNYKFHDRRTGLLTLKKLV